MNWKHPLDSIFGRMGYSKVNDPVALVTGVDLVLDVGANLGQTYQRFRRMGYQGPIISFEPNPHVFKQLQAQTGNNWQKVNSAVSSTSGTASFNIARSHDHSGLLRGHKSFHGDQSDVMEVVKVPLTTIADYWKANKLTAASAWLKIDTEGHDLSVMRGAIEIFPSISVVEAELSPQPRYEGEEPMRDAINFMGERGFTIARIEPLSFNPGTGCDEAFNVIFQRTRKS